MKARLSLDSIRLERKHSIFTQGLAAELLLIASNYSAISIEDRSAYLQIAKDFSRNGARGLFSYAYELVCMSFV